MRRILITGANRGIGLALVREYLERPDTHVFATCRKPDEAKELNKLQSQYRERLYIVQLDVTDEDSIKLAAEKVADVVSGLDVLINNAAINPPGKYQTFESLEMEGLMFMFRVNVGGPLLVTRTFFDLLKAGDDPQVVNISSQMGSMEWMTMGGNYAYSPSKAALNMVTRSFATDLAPHGITSVTVHPGWVQTDMGGPQATLKPKESAEGIVKLTEKITDADNGKFFSWQGEIHPW